MSGPQIPNRTTIWLAALTGTLGFAGGPLGCTNTVESNSSMGWGGPAQGSSGPPTTAGSGASTTGESGASGSGGGTGTTGMGDPPPDMTPPGTELCAPPRNLRRLSNRRYGKAVRDLLGLDEAPLVTGGGGRLDTLVPGDTRLLSSDLGFEYSHVASEAAQAAELSPLLPCDIASGNRTCASEFISNFGLRAFRRPLAPEELEQLLAVYDVGAEAGFEAGIRLLLEAFLQSPSFLYQGTLAAPDAMGAVQLTSYDIAEMLGLLFFDSVPDSELLAAAEVDALSTEEGIVSQVERLLTLPSVREQLSWVLDGWLGGTGLLGKTKDSQLFPGYTAELGQSLWQSKHRFIDQLMWETGGGLAELFTSDQLWVNAPVAGFLGLPTPTAAEWELVNAPGGQRAGILTHPALMAQLASTDETSVVHRGLFLYNVVLCQPVTPPPEGAVEEGLAVAQKLEDERQRAAYRAEQPICNGCHAAFDPYGLAFEKYDAAGQYLADADGSASVRAPESIAGEYANAPALMTQLAAAPELAQCASKQLVSYALEAVAGQAEACVVEQVHERFNASPRTLVDLFRSLASAPAIYQRLETSP